MASLGLVYTRECVATARQSAMPITSHARHNCDGRSRGAYYTPAEFNGWRIAGHRMEPPHTHANRQTDRQRGDRISTPAAPGYRQASSRGDRVIAWMTLWEIVSNRETKAWLLFNATRSATNATNERKDQTAMILKLRSRWRSLRALRMFRCVRNCALNSSCNFHNAKRRKTFVVRSLHDMGKMARCETDSCKTCKLHVDVLW